MVAFLRRVYHPTPFYYISLLVLETLSKYDLQFSYFKIPSELRIIVVSFFVQVKLPPATRNFYVDGHVPQPH